MQRPIGMAALALLAATIVTSPAGATHERQAGRLASMEAGATELHAALTSEQRAMVDEKDLVVTFEETSEREGDVELRAVSLGTLRHSPSVVRGLLGSVSEYPSWVTLQPAYKQVRPVGASSFEAELGRAGAEKAKRRLVYDVRQDGDLTTWTLRSSDGALRPGSRISYEVVPHPSLEGASLVVHRQRVIVPDAGRITKYLTSDDSEGTNRYWKDANKHARRIHWAMDAALRHPAGRERKSLYCEHYQREFAGSLPWWAEAGRR